MSAFCALGCKKWLNNVVMGMGSEMYDSDDMHQWYCYILF